MRSSYAWTMKSWQRSEWRLGFNSVLTGGCVEGGVSIARREEGVSGEGIFELHEVVSSWEMVEGASSFQDLMERGKKEYLEASV